MTIGGYQMFAKSFKIDLAV